MLANEFILVEDVKLFSRRELLPADAAGETLEVEDAVSRLPDQVLRRDALKTARTLCPESSRKGKKKWLDQQKD